MSGADLFVICKSCGSEVSPYITECPYCGSRLRKRAPKLDRDGNPQESPGKRRARTPRPSLGPLRAGEIPGIRPDTRPYATITLLLASVVLETLVRLDAIAMGNVIVFRALGTEWWRPLTAPFVYGAAGYQIVCLAAIGLFGWLLERRLGALPVLLIFFAAGAGGMAIAIGIQPDTIALGGNGAALGLLAAWAVPDLLRRRAGEETDSDLLGVGVIAAVLLALPLAIADADAVAGVAGLLIGAVLGLGLHRSGR